MSSVESGKLGVIEEKVIGYDRWIDGLIGGKKKGGFCKAKEEGIADTHKDLGGMEKEKHWGFLDCI